MTRDVDRIDSMNIYNGSCCKWYHLFSLLQNVGAIQWSLFNGYCYKMWVQFHWSMFNERSYKTMKQNVGAIHWSLFNGHCYKMWVQFIGPC
jgi:hypothetical protein